MLLSCFVDYRIICVSQLSRECRQWSASRHFRPGTRCFRSSPSASSARVRWTRVLPPVVGSAELAGLVGLAGLAEFLVLLLTYFEGLHSNTCGVCQIHTHRPPMDCSQDNKMICHIRVHTLLSHERFQFSSFLCHLNQRLLLHGSLSRCKRLPDLLFCLLICLCLVFGLVCALC